MALLCTIGHRYNSGLCQIFPSASITTWAARFEYVNSLGKNDSISMYVVLVDPFYLKYGDPCNTDIIKRCCVIEWILIARFTDAVTLIPVERDWIIRSWEVLKRIRAFRGHTFFFWYIRTQTGSVISWSGADEIWITERWLVKLRLVKSEKMIDSVSCLGLCLQSDRDFFAFRL